MNQAQIVERMLEQIDLIDSNPTATPMHEACKLLTYMHEEQADVTLYRQMIGKLLYLTNSRLDIAFATNVLLCFM